ncbi:MAG: twin-arginine translocation signal domain-containing protein, partial [Gammaproteobacteria bacterium]|nr:twin-arginine translocation signal domain-containing protein [Gammaproteobacteria bacterium]
MSKCNCGPNDNGNCLSRRQFLRDTGAGVVALSAMGMTIPVMAGPFTVDDFESLVPTDKKLSEAWIRSLFERGEADWYSGEDLKHIGMPVGGICCGHVYLGGDGRLWHWDIFNQGIQSKTWGPHY